MQLFRKAFRNFVLVEVRASQRTRFERVLARSREDDVRDFEHFLARDSRESAWGLQRAIDEAEYVIDNEGTLEDLKATTADVVRSIEADC